MKLVRRMSGGSSATRLRSSWLSCPVYRANVTGRSPGAWPRNFSSSSLWEFASAFMG